MPMTGCTYSFAELVPHGPPFVLLDKVEDVFENGLEASIRIAEDSHFFQPFVGVHAQVGAEYMAQCIAAFNGLRQRNSGGNPQIGYLVGVREFFSVVPYFKAGEMLRVSVEESFNDGLMGVYQCSIRNISGEEIVTARLNVYQPK